MEQLKLSDREKSVLRHVIHQFILTANPVGSRNITKRYDLGVSAATVRNIMSDLEEFGLLNHPHTSAGRVPTDSGYRFYVDSLIEPKFLDNDEISQVEAELELISNETDDLLKLTSTILSKLTNQIACVTYPKFDKAILEKLQIVQLSSTRILVVISVASGLVKTITLELSAEINDKHLQKIQNLLNEKLSGLPFSEIRNTFADRIKEYVHSEFKPIIRLFLDSADKIFTDLKVSEKSILTGAKNIINQPEFGDPSQFQGIIELIEDKDVIVHIMEKSRTAGPEDIEVIIGSESDEIKLTDYSLIKKGYKVGEASGLLGIIGPKRMEYSKAIAAVVYFAELLSKELKN